ncbi:MAG: acyl carrier protein [Pseudomonadales bacterium]
MDRSEIEHHVRDVVVGLNILEAPERLAEQTSLYDAGMTSHASVRLMLALEDRFDLEFPDEMLQRESFESIDAITRAIHAVRSGVTSA